MVTLLSGGTGTPKLLWGAGSVFSPSEITVIGNTGDDVVLGDLHVSPDIDTILFERGGVLDRETWWGIADDPTETTDRVAELVNTMGIDVSPRFLPDAEQSNGRRLSRWRRFARVPEFMTIGDRDRAHHMVRSQLLDDGWTLTEVTRALADAYGLTIDVLPMSDDPVATFIETPEGPMHFQEFWVGRHGSPVIEDVEFLGGAEAGITDPVARALGNPVVIGPANPVTSLGPMFAIPAFKQLIRNTPTVLVSPFIGEDVFSGPAASLLEGIGREASTAGIANHLPEVDAFVLDEADATDLDRPIVRTDTKITEQGDATRVAKACRTALEKVS